MKIIYELDMDKEEDFERKDHIDNAYKYHSIIWNLYEWLRLADKADNSEERAYTIIKEKLQELMNEKNITL